MSIMSNINVQSISNFDHFFYVKTAHNIFTQNYGKNFCL